MLKLSVVLAAIPTVTGCVDNLYADMVVAGGTTFAAVIGEVLAAFVTAFI
jgi:hypothetical protein